MFALKIYFYKSKVLQCLSDWLDLTFSEVAERFILHLKNMLSILIRTYLLKQTMVSQIRKS